MGSRKQVERRKRQAEMVRRRKERLRDPDGWHPPPPPEAAWLKLEPRAAKAEPVEDIALFDAAALAALPPETRAEADIVREALDLVAAGEPHAALDRLTAIGRKSAYADWRLFVRGLAAFQTGDLAWARDAWSRLAADRRPSRIAAVLAGAWEEVREAPQATGQPTTGNGPRAAAVAMLGRGSLWAAAREVAAIRHRDEDRTFSASQAALLIRLEKQYREIDPDFVCDFSAACRFLAMGQDDPNPLVALCHGTAGPPDDPRNTRLQFVCLRMFDADASDLRACIRDYVDRDLSGAAQLPTALRAALASTGLCLTAESILEENADGPFGGLSREDDQICERLLREAIERCARNDRAHERLVKLLEDRAAQKNGGREAERAVVAAKTAFVAEFPDRHEHLIDLVDRLMQKQEFEQAEPLVRLLADQRCTQPAARATPWRFALGRASWLATRAGRLPEARGELAAAIAAWPPWMSRNWIPLLEVTLLLREGDEGGHAAALEAARRALPYGVYADVLEYEALVMLGGRPSRVKPLATKLLDAAKQTSIDAHVGPLASVACFYLDLERSGLDPMAGHHDPARGRDHPARGRDHPARALGRALVNRLGQQGKWALGSAGGPPDELPVHDPAFWAAFRWLAKHEFFGGVNPKREPRGLMLLADSHPRAAAEVLCWLASAAPEALTSRRSRKRLALVEGAVPGENNPVVRDWLTTIVARVREALAEAEQRKRERRRQARTPARHGSFFNFGFQLSPEFEAPAEMPPFFRLILARGGPGALAELIPLLMGPKTPRNAERIATLCMRHDISPAEFFAAIQETDAFFHDQE